MAFCVCNYNNYIAERLFHTNSSMFDCKTGSYQFLEPTST